ncbi:DUF6356 family protein [Brevundimonas aurantiaca]|jgi:hypothetical protein|uniref:DUF6356 family protein n=1 Tax=Brevundimonas aurantiaca TaxID=74316 RepID=UPI00191B08DD|nr:DUF6356 family protein [Brevundimonas aurantiaca]
MSQTTIDRARRGSTAFDRLFRDHPREVGETYLQHMAASTAFAFRLLRLAGAAFAHALIPGVHKTTVSTAIRGMAQEMGGRAEEAKQSRMRDAGVWDVGL